jgi:hypothetical protein
MIPTALPLIPHAWHLNALCWNEIEADARSSAWNGQIVLTHAYPVSRGGSHVG